MVMLRSFIRISFSNSFRIHSRTIGFHKLMSTKTEQEWRAILTPEQFRVLRQKGLHRVGYNERITYISTGTERPGTGEYNKFYDKGLIKTLG